MAPRAMWKGQMKLSLVTFGVRLYAATESARRVSMNQLHAECHQRVKNQTICPVHGPIGRDEIVKGYEYEKDTYVIIEPEDLESIRLDSSKTIDLVEFVDRAQINSMLIDAPYYLGPDGPVAEEPFRVIREAMTRADKVAIGRIVMSNRERIVAIEPEGRGFTLTTLRYADEVRSPEQFFDDIGEGDVDDELLELAESIIASKSGEFDPSDYTDEYRDAFFEMVKRKVAGQEPVVVEDEEQPSGFNFMEALKRSVEASGAEAPTAKSGGSKKKAASKKKPAKKKTVRKAKSKTKKKTARKPAAKSSAGKSKKKTSKKKSA